MKLSDNFKDTEGEKRHNNTGKKKTARNRDICFLFVEIEHTSGESAGPGTCARERNADEERECDIDAVTSFFLEFFTTFFAFFKTPFAEFCELFPFYFFAPFEKTTSVDEN